MPGTIKVWAEPSVQRGYGPIITEYPVLDKRRIHRVATPMEPSLTWRNWQQIATADKEDSWKNTAGAEMWYNTDNICIACDRSQFHY